MKSRKLHKLDKLLMELCDEHPGLVSTAQKLAAKIREVENIEGSPDRFRYEGPGDSTDNLLNPTGGSTADFY